MENVVGENRGVYRGEVDATCVQIGLRGKRITPWRGKNSPDIWVIRNI